MLKPVATVRDAILREFPDGCASLQAITRIVSGVTMIDHVWFIEYDVPRANPIWGSFRRFERRLAVYEPLQTIVEVRYARHLSEAERRFVVCKELCHALDGDNGEHHVSNAAIEALVAKFSLMSQGDLAGPINAPLRAEHMAEICSIEILCPLPVRKQLIGRLGAKDKIDYEQISAKFGLPVDYAELAFKNHYMSWIEARFAED